MMSSSMEFKKGFLEEIVYGPSELLGPST